MPCSPHPAVRSWKMASRSFMVRTWEGVASGSWPAPQGAAQQWGDVWRGCREHAGGVKTHATGGQPRVWLQQSRAHPP